MKDVCRCCLNCTFSVLFESLCVFQFVAEVRRRLPVGLSSFLQVHFNRKKTLHHTLSFLTSQLLPTVHQFPGLYVTRSLHRPQKLTLIFGLFHPAAARAVPLCGFILKGSSRVDSFVLLLFSLHL